MVGSDVPMTACDWGLNGLRAVARGRIVIIVDVLSFSTATTIAVGRGATILPCQWNDQRASALALEHGAELASKRGQGRFSLAPASLREVPAGLRLVLPSPNGSTLADAARELDAAAIAVGCLRNAAAIARWAAEQQRDIAVIAAGERWDDGSIRFAIEDWLGAGAVISRIRAPRSAVAEAAVAAFEKLQPLTRPSDPRSGGEGRLRDALANSPSGRELIELGYPDDIDLAAELDADDVVPLLDGNAFTLARS